MGRWLLLLGTRSLFAFRNIHPRTLHIHSFGATIFFFFCIFPPSVLASKKVYMQRKFKQLWASQELLLYYVSNAWNGSSLRQSVAKISGPRHLVACFSLTHRMYRLPLFLARWMHKSNTTFTSWMKLTCVSLYKELLKKMQRYSITFIFQTYTHCTFDNPFVSLSFSCRLKNHVYTLHAMYSHCRRSKH